MTWEPPPRPEWVRRSTTGASCPSPRWRSCRSRATRCWRRRAPRSGVADGGIADFGSDDFLEPLDVLLPALEHEAELTVIGTLDDAAVPAALPRGAPPARRVRARRPRRRRRGDPRAVVRDRRAPHRHDDPARAARAGPGVTRARRVGAAAAGPAARAPTPTSSPPTPASRSPTASCDCPARSPASSTPSTCTAAACTRNACRRCRSRSGRRSSPPGTTCRRTSTGTSGATCGPRTTRTGSCCRSCNAASRDVHWVLKSPVHLERAADAVRGLPRRPAGDHPPRPAHRARLAHQPGGDAAVGAQRPGRLRRDRSLPRATCGRTRSTIWSPRRPTARSIPHACTTCTTPTSCRTRSVWSASCTARSGARSRPRPRRRCAPTSPVARRTSTARTSTRSPTSSSIPVDGTRAVRALPAALLGARGDPTTVSDDLGAVAASSSRRLDELGRRDHRAAVPGHRRRPRRRAPAPRAADRLLAGVVARPPGPARAGVPAPERPRPAVGRAERRQRLPPRARRTLAAVPHRREDALVRRLHPRHPPQLHAHGGLGHDRRAQRARPRPGSGRRLRDPPRRRGRRAEPRAAPRGRAVGVDPRVLLRLAAARAGDVHHRVPRRRRSARRVHVATTSRSGSTRRRPTCTARSRTGTSTCSTRAPAQTDNEFGGGYDVQRGLDAAKYAFCFFDLAPDEALVVDCDIPDSRYWSFHLYNLAWWEALEYATRVTSLNHTQTRISDDGRVRVVVAHEDPGVAQLARHRGPARGAAHAAVVLAARRSAVAVDPGGEAGRRARRAARRHARRSTRRATPRRDPAPPRPPRLALPHLGDDAGRPQRGDLVGEPELLRGSRRCARRARASRCRAGPGVPRKRVGCRGHARAPDDVVVVLLEQPDGDGVLVVDELLGRQDHRERHPLRLEPRRRLAPCVRLAACA